MQEFNETWLKGCPEPSDLSIIAQKVRSSLLFVATTKSSSNTSAILEYAHYLVREDGYVESGHSVVDPEEEIEEDAKSKRLDSTYTSGAPALETLLAEAGVFADKKVLLIAWDTENSLLEPVKTKLGGDHEIVKNIQEMKLLDYRLFAKKRLKVSNPSFIQFAREMKCGSGLHVETAYRRVALMMKWTFNLGSYEFQRLYAAIQIPNSDELANMTIKATMSVSNPTTHPYQWARETILNRTVKYGGDQSLDAQILAQLKLLLPGARYTQLQQLTYSIGLAIGAMIKENDEEICRALRTTVCDDVKPALRELMYEPKLRLNQCKEHLTRKNLSGDNYQIRIALKELGHPLYS